MWNGPEINGPNKIQYIEWLISIGVNEDIVDNFLYYEKEFGYIREVIDYGFSDDDIIKVIKTMEPFIIRLYSCVDAKPTISLNSIKPNIK